MYAEITTAEIEHKKYASRNDIRQNNNRQHHSQAIRKKNISHDSIEGNYSHHFSSIESSLLQNLKSNLEHIKQRALKAITENQEQQEKQTKEIKTKRHVDFAFHNKYNYSKNITNSILTVTPMKIFTKQNAETLIDKLKSNSPSLDNWFELKNTKMNRNQLDHLFSTFAALKNIILKKQSSHSDQLNLLFSTFTTLKNRVLKKQASYSDKLQRIEFILIEKYRFVILQEITTQLPPYLEVIDNIQLTPECTGRYLIEDKKNDNNIFNHISKILNRYFSEINEEQNIKISKFCEESLLPITDEKQKILKRCLETFVLEVGKLEKTHPSIKKYYDEYVKYLEEQQQSLNSLYDQFKSELSLPKYAEVLDLWKKTITDKSLINKLEKKIQEDNNLNVLYDGFNIQIEQEYDWGMCCKDKDFLKEYSNYIQEKGPLSENYRELLAYAFDCNIRLYIEDQNNELSLQDSYNSSSEQVTHFLYKYNKFVQLSINKEYVKLEEERKNKDNMYIRILKQINSIKHKQTFDNYLQKRTFLLNSEEEKFNQSFSTEYNTNDETEQETEKREYDNYLSVTESEKWKQSFYNNFNNNSPNEEKDIRKIIEYFPEEEKQQLQERLGKITSQYIGQQAILNNILKRFSFEGRYVSSHELYYLVNSILISIIKDRKEINIFCWIIVAYPQEKWMDELIILQLENYFQKCLEKKNKWKEYLSKIENKDMLLLFGVKLDQSNSISTQCIENILYLLSNISSRTVILEELELSEWPYALKEQYWTYKLSKLIDSKNDDLSTASFYLLSIENTYGTDLVEAFLNILEDKLRKEKKQNLSYTLTDILSNFHTEKWLLNDEVLKTLNSCNINDWVVEIQRRFTTDEKERDITHLVKLIQGNFNTSKKISDILPGIADSIRSIRKEEHISVKTTIPVNKFTENDIKNWLKVFHNNIKKRMQDMNETHKDMLTVIDRAIELKKGFKLRDTQKLTVLVLLTNNRSTLAQVSTGEGKSLIVVATAIIKALCGEKVDIITSSSVLAKRDAEGNRVIYRLFDINVSHNCNEDIEKRKEAYSCNKVIYGDLANFQRDYLLQNFYGKTILGDHKFENVIVDEVDSMLLDKGNNMLYLSHDLVGIDKLESIYIYIWQWINRPASDKDELSYAFNTKAIQEAVLGELYDIIKKEDIDKLDSKLSKQQKNIIWERLIKAKILDDQGKLLKTNITNYKLNEILTPEFSNYQDRLSYLLKECVERDKCIHAPNYLRPFVEQHLESWIDSAKTAFFRKAGQDYVVDVDRTGTSPDRNPNIIILDTETGTDLANSQWAEAFHQFLQLKHGCKLSLQSLKAVFISNVSYFKLYSNLYGLTGTLGSHRERDLLRDLHEVDYVTIPTAKSKLFSEDVPILCTDKEEWFNEICNNARKLTEKKRSVLIICETVNEVETLHDHLGGKNTTHVRTYTRDYEEFDIAEGNKTLDQGQIIIATNLAGRGTDIKISKGLRNAGGLHICLTYLPNNVRVEQQAFGRAARSGDKGSGQLIIMESKGQGYSNLKILDLKKERDDKELRRISGIKLYYETQITVEEIYFTKFKEQYEYLSRMLSVPLKDKSLTETITDMTDVLLTVNLQKLKDKIELKDIIALKDKSELKEILLQSCLDKWAFWLDRNSNYIKDVKNEQINKVLDNSLNKFLSQLKKLRCTHIEDLLDWVEGNPVQMVKLGKYLSKNEKYKDAIRLFDDVIQQEPAFSEAAHYYKAFALVKEIDWEQNPLKDEDKKIFKILQKELREASKLLDEHIKFTVTAAGIIGKIKKSNTESIINIDTYENQQNSLAKLYYIFSESIDDIFGHLVTPQSFVNNEIKEELAEILYEDLLRNDILKKSKVKKNISEEELKIISSYYGMSVQILKNFLFELKGKEINEKEFKISFKENVPLPSKEAFWKSLIKQGILYDEIKYIIVNNDKLSEINPSESFGNVNKEVLEKLILESNDEQIFLSAERIEQQKNCDIFKKDDLIKFIGKSKYQTLKKKGVFSFNRKANIMKKEIESATFSFYDSISLKDFSMVDINKSEAEIILSELVKQNIIEKKKNSVNSNYRLKIEFDKIKEIQLSSCPVYEDAVKGLLSICFTYSIALQKIARQLKDKNIPFRIQLMTKPHQSLIWELLEHKIIKPITVTTKIEDLEKKLKNLYSLPTTKDNFIRMLSQSILMTEGFTDELFNHLVEKEWITPYSASKLIRENVITAVKDIANVGKSLVQHLYSINNPDKKQLPLNSYYKDYESVVKKILDNRLQLAKENTIKDIARTLERLRGKLKALKFPDSNLKSLTEFCSQDKSENIEEVRVFFLNGLDRLLQLEEKKWTREMLYNTKLVVLMGIGQIVIGTAIELFSMGVFTHVGGAFISEGINDIMFTASAFRSGSFNWNDYKQHKIESLMFTVVTIGIGALLSKGIKKSHFGYKLCGPNFEKGKKVAEMTGFELMNTVGYKEVGKAVTKRIILKATEGVAYSLANVGVDIFIENYLQRLCEDIASTILSDIVKTVEKHNISITLRQVYKILGEENSRKLVDKLTKIISTEKSFVEKFSSNFSKIADCVTKGIKEASKKGSKTANSLQLSINAISKTIDQLGLRNFLHIAEILKTTNNILDNLDGKIKDELNKKQWGNTNPSSPNKKQETEKGYETFKKETLDKWKLILREKTGQLIVQNIISPVLKKGANHLVGYVGKQMQNAYHSYKESGYLEYFDTLKQKYQKELMMACGIPNVNTSELLQKQITQDYHKNLLKLAAKTTNPKLYANIVRENIPMDFICVNACTTVLPTLLNQETNQIKRFTINIEGEGGMRQTFSSGPEGAEEVIVKLRLEDNHFQLDGNSMSENSGENTEENNCLYEALSKQMSLNMTSEEFRHTIADHIEHDPNIRYTLEQKWHRIPILLGAFGGKRADANACNDEESSSLSEYGDITEYRYRIRSIRSHFKDRCIRYIRFGGQIQRISENTEITRENVIKGDKSEFQDQKSHRGPEKIHAAHLFRANDIHKAIGNNDQFKEGKSSEQYNELRNTAAHTQNVPKDANLGIGRVIDEIQTECFSDLCKINFNKENPSTIDSERIQNFKNKFVNALDKHVNNAALTRKDKLEYNTARETIANLDVTDLFEEGKKGYSGKSTKRYQEGYTKEYCYIPRGVPKSPKIEKRKNYEQQNVKKQNNEE